MRRTFIYGSLLILLSGCNSLANLHIINPTYSLRGVNPRVNLGIPPSMDFDFTVGVDNPNSVELRLDHFNFDFLINNNPVLNNIRSDQGVHIPARGIGDVHLTTHVTYDNIRTIWREVQDVVQGNRASYGIRGNAYYDTPVGRLQFPVTVYSR
ncbi:MAG TPA: LEA type 2 family protein [Thermoanaerobaculia bacterium]